jgi:hypothetical protein
MFLPFTAKRSQRDVNVSPLLADRPSTSRHRLGITITAILGVFAGSALGAAQAITRVAVINTIAGNGIAGYVGDSGPATSAELNSPYGLAIGNGGNLYIADPANNRIRQVALGTGTISTFAGNGTAGYSGDNGPATKAELQSPVGVATDSSGNLYIADEGNNVIRKVDISGTITTIAGNNTEGYSGDNGLATSASLSAPSGVAVDSAGSLFIVDTGNNRIREVNTAGTIATIAGNGTAGYTGDNGPANSATLNKPSAVLEDSTGDLYILDTANNVVRKVNTTGTITTIAGNGTAGYTGDNGPATSATLNTPEGLNIDGSGNLYIADSMNDAVRMVTAAGVITTVTGNGTPGYSGDGGPAVNATLNNPRGVTIDGIGNIYISDRNNNRVREVATPAGSVAFPTTAVSSTSTAVTIPLEVNTPTTITGVTVPLSQGGKQEYAVTANTCPLNTALESGTLCNVTVTFTPGYAGLRPMPLQLASSAGTFGIGMAGIGTAPQVALSPGIFKTLAITDSPSSPYGSDQNALTGIAVDSSGNIYAVVGNSSAGTNSIVEFATGTGILTTILPPTALTSTSDNSFVLGLGLDSAGDLFIANPKNSCVVKVAAGSAVATIVAGISPCGASGYGGDNGLATNAQLNHPSAVAVDSAGNLYIADSGNGRIRKVAAATGIITTVAGNGTGSYSGDNEPAINAGLSGPTAVALDSADNLYIADSNRIRKIAAATGIITTVAGNGAYGYSGDNGPATSAELSSPYAVALDSAGEIYILDNNNNVVRLVNADGMITSLPGTAQIDTGNAGIIASFLPYSRMALDSAGNLYLAGLSYGGVSMVDVSASTLNFPLTPIGSSSPQTLVVRNTGNAPLTLAVPSSGQNPSFSTGFSQDSSSSCPQLDMGSAPASLAPGMSCSIVVDFVPATTAGVNGTASITDNAVNASPAQTVLLTGAGGEVVGTTTTINVTTPVFGQTQVSATILALAGTLAPTGSVVFTVDGTLQPTVTLNGSGVATLPSTVSSVLAVGSHTIEAVYTSNSLGFTNSNATRVFSVSPVPPTVAVAPSTTSLSVAPGSSVTDTITVTPMGGYSGSLQFSCTGLPQNATCSFQPATVTVTGTGGPQTTVVTIQTAGGTADLRPGPPSVPEKSPLLPAAAFWAPGLLSMAFARKKGRIFSQRSYVLLAFVLSVAIFTLAGCGGGGSSSPTKVPTTPSAPVTPAGTSTVQITAANSGTAVQSFALTLTVQ